MRVFGSSLVVLALASSLCQLGVGAVPHQGGTGREPGLQSEADGQYQHERILASALQSHQAGDFEGAIREYKQYLALRPDNVQARSNLGAALAHLGRYEEAIEEYKQALAADPRSPSAAGIRLNLALSYYKSAQIPEAASELTAVRAGLAPSSPQYIQTSLLLADCDLRQGQFKDVIELLSPLDSEHREDRTLAYLLGTALIRDDQVEKGQALVDRILRDGDSAEARLMMGTAKFMGNDFHGALEDLRRAVELNPKLPSVHSIYGQALMKSGDQQRAREAFHQELTIDPNDFDANFYLGHLLREDQNYDESLLYLKRALQVRSGNLAVRYQIGLVDLSTGKIDDAQQELEQVVKESPDFVEGHVSLATVYYRLKRKQDGDRERAIVQKLNAEAQARQPGAQDKLGPAYRGEPVGVPKPN